VNNILADVKYRVQAGELDNVATQAVVAVLEPCKTRVERLQKIFLAVLPQQDGSTLDQFSKAARTLGKGTEVDTLMKELLEDIGLLSAKFGMYTGDSVGKLQDAIKSSARQQPDGTLIDPGDKETACQNTLRLTDPQIDRETLRSGKGT
jgi:hypothetical protein